MKKRNKKIILGIIIFCIIAFILFIIRVFFYFLPGCKYFEKELAIPNELKEIELFLKSDNIYVGNNNYWDKEPLDKCTPTLNDINFRLMDYSEYDFMNNLNLLKYGTNERFKKDGYFKIDEIILARRIDCFLCETSDKLYLVLSDEDGYLYKIKLVYGLFAGDCSITFDEDDLENGLIFVYKDKKGNQRMLNDYCFEMSDGSYKDWDEAF